MAAVVMQSSERVFEQMDQPIRRAVDRLPGRRSMFGDRHRWMSLEPRFHHATLVVASGLGCVLIGEMYFDSRDVRAEAAECVLDGGAHRVGQRFAAFYVVVGIDEDLHGVTRVGAGSGSCRQLRLAFARVLHNAAPNVAAWSYTQAQARVPAWRYAVYRTDAETTSANVGQQDAGPGRFAARRRYLTDTKSPAAGVERRPRISMRHLWNAFRWAANAIA